MSYPRNKPPRLYLQRTPPTTNIGPGWTLHVDGAFNVHECGAGIVLSAPDGTNVEYALRFQFKTTNNEAEYEALLAGLRLAQDLGAKKIAHIAIQCSLSTRSTIPTKSGARTRANM